MRDPKYVKMKAGGDPPENINISFVHLADITTKKFSFFDLRIL